MASARSWRPLAQIDEWLGRIERTGAADVQRVLREHLTRERRVVVITKPKPAEAAPAAEPKQ